MKIIQASGISKVALKWFILIVEESVILPESILSLHNCCSDKLKKRKTKKEARLGFLLQHCRDLN